jgi:DNA modification methylase
LGSTSFENYRPSYGMILFATNKGKRKMNTTNPANLFITKKIQFKHHPAEKGEDVLEWLINNSTVKGETILDPFCGSGSTLVVAEKLGRNWIGIEIDPKWHEVAKMRILELRKKGNKENGKK